MLDLEQQTVRAWLGQFQAQDEVTAYRLLELIHYVDAGAFVDGLSNLIRETQADANAPVALYAERKVGHRKGVAHHLFKQKRKRPRRAFGPGPAPVRSQHQGRHETGSEGIVANIITQANRRDRTRFFDHPGPETFRKRKIRRLVLVTDFVGTADQSQMYLDAVWKAASIKSWASGGFLRFDVVCYAATTRGKRRLEEHPCDPVIRQVISAPTLDDFEPYEISDIRDLISRYGPRPNETNIPMFGYGGIGALIAFAHGVPNNVPRLLFAKGRRWTPLFPARVASAARRATAAAHQELIARRLSKLREKQIAEASQTLGLNVERDGTLLVLSALKRKPRTAETVSARTGLGFAETLAAIESAKDAGWLDADNRLTANAYAEFDYLKRQRERPKAPVPGSNDPYFPNELRAPVRRFS